MSVKRARTIGKMSFPTKKTRKTSKINPKRSKKSRKGCRFSGKRAKRSFEPSSGGTGMRLKMAKIILIKTMTVVISTKAGLAVEPKKRSIRPKSRAKVRFEAGPAAATRASDQRPGFRL